MADGVRGKRFAGGFEGEAGTQELMSTRVHAQREASGSNGGAAPADVDISWVVDGRGGAAGSTMYQLGGVTMRFDVDVRVDEARHGGEPACRFRGRPRTVADHDAVAADGDVAGGEFAGGGWKMPTCLMTTSAGWAPRPCAMARASSPIRMAFMTGQIPR